MPPETHLAIQVAVFDFPDSESLLPNHGSDKEIHQAKTVPGSDHCRQCGRLMRDDANRWFESARLNCRPRLVPHALVRHRIPDCDHRIGHDLLKPYDLRLEHGMTKRSDDHKRLPPERSHHEGPVGGFGATG